MDARVSVVVPFYNEEDNVLPLIQAVHQALNQVDFQWELLLINDGSTDSTAQKIKQGIEQFGKHVRLIDLTRNFKQTAAMQAGIDFARGEIIVTMDGDLQNDPKDIPKMVSRLIQEDLDLVAGWRQNRQDDLFLRKIPSQIANRLIAKITGVKLRDYGCSLKAYRASVLKKIRLYGEMHRFIPAWLATVTTPCRIKEEPTTHHARTAGVSKYGISRTFRVVLDLFAVYFFMNFKARPGHFFGGIGLMVSAVSFLILMWLFCVKFFLGQDIGARPLLIVGIGGLIAGLQFIATGILAEILARVYFESGKAAAYFVHEENAFSDLEAWKK